MIYVDCEESMIYSVNTENSSEYIVDKNPPTFWYKKNWACTQKLALDRNTISRMGYLNILSGQT